MEKENECRICAAHDKATKEVEYKPPSCPNCGVSLGQDGILSLFSHAKTVIADEYDKPPFEHTEIYSCDNCRANFTITAVPVIWNANHDIYYRRHPGDAKPPLPTPPTKSGIPLDNYPQDAT
jgi:hypothetical protein